MMKSILRTASLLSRSGDGKRPADGAPSRPIPAVTITASGCRCAGVFGGERADRTPVELVTAMGEERQKAVAQQAGDRHRHAQTFSGGKHQLDVRLAERRRKAGRLELCVREKRAVGLVNGRTE